MPRTKGINKNKKINLEKKIISQIKSGDIEIKPKWHFMVGSLLLFSSLIGLSMGIVFLTNLCVFLIRRNGRFMPFKLHLIISSFPWWIPALALIGFILGIRLLKKYDFSYKKNFILIIIIFVISILLSGVLVDKFGLNEHLSRGRMKKFYQRLEQPKNRKQPSRRGKQKNSESDIKGFQY